MENASSMEIRDYNGKGKWASEAIRARYLDYAAKAGILAPLNLQPKVSAQGNVRWIYPLMDEVIAGIEAGDTACATIGVEFLEEDGKFSFGAILKMRTARALRRAQLSQAQQLRLRRRITSMLITGNVPREFREYVRLLRKIGFDDFWPRLQTQVPRNNPYVMRYFDHLQSIHEGSPAVMRQGHDGKSKAG